MDGGIYLREDGTLVEMVERDYEYESVLQKNLADFPRLLAGDQMDENSPRRWALVAREAAVPDREGGNDRWSADHLFVDQDGIPTLVEVKRSDDTRVRREVVGQMLDYISHACLYWDAKSLKAKFTRTCEDRDIAAGQALAELVDGETDNFWTRVEARLRSRQVRLLFVADEIPAELKRIVEFLNEEFSSVEVFAIEVKQYASDRKTAFVPRLYGQTEEAKSSKSNTARPNHGEDDLLEDVAEKERDGTLSSAEADTVRDLYEFIREEADGYDFGGSSNVSVTARWEVIGGSNGMFTVNSSGTVAFWQPGYNRRKNGASWDREIIEEWYSSLEAIDHPEIDPINGDTKFPVAALNTEDRRSDFKQACLEFAAALEA